MRLGLIGLGKMGSRIAFKLLQEGHSIVAWNRSSTVVEELQKNHELGIKNQGLGTENKSHNSSFVIHDSKRGRLVVAQTVRKLVSKLSQPRIVWLMLPQGAPTEEMLSEVSKYVERDDIVIDGGNAYYKDTERRYQEFKKKGIKFLGIGVSGGIIAAKKGYPLMAGGNKSAYQYIKPILDSLAKPHGGHEYFGIGGAGHFVKMIHNGIEYGIMQSLGEGFGVLDKAKYDFNLLKVAKLWQKGTLVSGFMLDRAVEALADDPKLSSIKGYIEESGEARWTVIQAKEEGVEVEIIEKSLEFRRRSQTDSRVSSSFAAKMVAALRNKFGGHAVRSKKK